MNVMKQKHIYLYLIIMVFCILLQRPLASESSRSKSSRNKIKISLERALLLAINNNIDLKTMHMQQRLYKQSIYEQYREFFPSLSFSYMRTEDTVKGESDTQHHRISVDSEIVIYDGGKRSLSLDISKLKRVLAAQEYKVVRNKIIMQTLQAYLEIIKLRDSIHIHKLTLKRGRMQLAFIKKEYKLGTATKFQVLEIEAKVKEIELSVQKALDDYALAVNQFKLLLKIDWRNNVVITGSIENFTLKQMPYALSVRDYIAKAIHNRNEIMNSDIELGISKRTHRLNQLYYFPKFSIGLNYNLSDDRFTRNQYIPREKGWGVTFKVSTALFGNSADATNFYSKSQNNKAENRSKSGGIKVLDSMSYKSALLGSEIDLVKAEQKTKDIRQNVSIEVLSSYNAMRNAWKMITIAEKQLHLYDTQLTIERLKANMGESRRYDLIKKEIERGEAAIAKLSSKVRYIATVSSLELAMGVNVGYLKLYNIKNKKKRARQ